MKIPKEEENEEGKTVVVGVKMDPDSREVLTWALVKVARAGDHVIALHVIPTAAEVSNPNGKCSSLLSVVKAFDSVLAVYDGLCNMKKIDLKLKLCRGSSVRKVLVRETKSFAATNLILGIAKNRRGITSSSTSIAKYCSKKLHRDCSVLAVNNGKIVFQSESSGNLAKNVDAPRLSFHCLPAVSKARSNCGTINRDDLKDYNGSFCSPISSPLSSPALEGKEQNSTKSKKDESLALIFVKKRESPSSSIPSLLYWELPEPKPGWPLLRKAVLTDQKTNPKEKSMVSVVQWAMQLPSRYTAPSVVHPGRKNTKTDASTESNSDGENWAIVSVGRTNSFRSLAIHDEEKELPEELKSLQERYSSVCSLFSYKELKKATSDFSPENLIGKGGSSRVYKGYLSDGKELAVKILKPSEDALNEFVSEIEIITALHHKNILSLFGFCFENNNLILVYDFLSRGSLEDNLHGEKENTNALSWAARYKIALGVTEALDYLHGGGSSQPVIHRDVKSSNILLSEDFEPQLSDFGLAKWASSSSSHMECNDVAGTFGYLAPEYFMYGKVNEKIDVYAFGVVLLELISGRKPISTGCPKGEESLVMWAKAILQGEKVKQLVDPCLGDKYDDDQMERMILAASLCIRRAPRSRPGIALVMKLLQGDIDVLKWARSQVNASEEFDGLDDEAAQPNSIIQSHINLALSSM